MLNVAAIADAFVVELSRAVTGRFLSEKQIRSIARSTIGKYFADFLPEPKDERAARERVEEARQHIGKASSIISQMQQELAQQSVQLDVLLMEIEEKRKLAEKYEQLAATNQRHFAAFRTEMEEALRQELIAQQEKGRRLRQLASFAIWFVTLILGASLGAYFKEIVEWAAAIFG